ncbi:MAG TPA: hypothetical protein PLR06_00610, partial [Cyclobacteriaceae bacterium]|nr:hypothetical protein [Cyclobacteriaceae bacterium]
QGFFWWEIDITYYILRGLAAVGLIWDLKGVPKHIKLSKNRQEAAELKKKLDGDRAGQVIAATEESLEGA